MSDTLYLKIGFDILVGILVGVFLLALWKGDAPERIGAGVNMAAGLVATGLQYVLSPEAQPIILLFVDGALAAAFLVLALRYASLWLGAALLLQAVQFSLHAYYLVVGARHDYAYKVVNNLDTSGILLAILVGIGLAWRRRAKQRPSPLASQPTSQIPA